MKKWLRSIIAIIILGNGPIISAQSIREDLFRAKELLHRQEYTDALNHYEKLLKSPDLSLVFYRYCLRDAAVCCLKTGDYNQAIAYLNQILAGQEPLPDELYLNVRNQLGNIYENLGEYKLALENYKICTEKLKNRELKEYATALNNMAIVYQHSGQYKKALELYQTTLDIRGNLPGKPDYSISLGNIGAIYGEMGEYAKAIDYYLKCLNDITPAQKLRYGQCMANLGFLYFRCHEKEKAIDCMEKALICVEENELVYATVLSNLSDIYVHEGKIMDGINGLEKSLEKIRYILGEKNPEYARILIKIAAAYQRNNNIQEATFYYSKFVQTEAFLVAKYFGFMTEFAREHYWLSRDKSLDKCYALGLDKQVQPDYFNTLYDYALLSKGILLNSSKGLRQLVIESKDTSLMQKFNRLNAIRSGLKNQMNTTVLFQDSLENVADCLEKEIIKKSADYGNYIRHLNISWKDVQVCLPEKAIAIELVNFSSHQDTTVYAALLLRKGWEHPLMVPLFGKNELDSLKLPGGVLFAEAMNNDTPANKKRIYESKALGDLIWGPLLEYMGEGDKIYFSPSGILHQIAIEYLPLKDTVTLAGQYQVFRCSSTKQLIVGKENQVHTAILFGGLKYEPDEGSLQNSIPYLSGTREEVKAIDSILKQADLKIQLYTDALGTEETFKALSGKKINLLHLATHGFFFDKGRDQYCKVKLTHTEIPSQTEQVMGDEAMMNAGLLLSGVKSVFDADTLPGEVEDGVLTAKELSFLDFRNLDLVVLSACQTGLGEITGDGVFGLQRGFKKAGAETLIMSLWKVDDEATRIMMTHFYTNLLGGQSKHNAFRNAQNDLKNYEREEEVQDNRLNPLTGKREIKKHIRKIKYDNPIYWAAFIMLD